MVFSFILRTTYSKLRCIAGEISPPELALQICRAAVADKFGSPNNFHEFTILLHIQFLQRIFFVTVGVIFISYFDNFLISIANYTQQGF